MLVPVEDFKEFYSKVVTKATRKKNYQMPDGTIVSHFFKGSHMIGRKVLTTTIGKDIYETVFVSKEYGRFNYER